MPCHNTEAFLSAAVESVLAQTHRALELVLVLDNCSDASPEIAARYAGQDERVRLLHRQNRSVGKTTNDGIAAAQFEWVAILHADDVWMPEKLEKQLLAAQARPEVVCWGTYGYHIDGQGRRISVSETGPTSVEEFQRVRATGDASVLIHSSFLVRKAHLDRIGGYNHGLDGCEDLDLLDRLGEIGPFVAIPERLMERRLHETSITMRSFMKMQHLTRYIEARRRALNAGQPFVTFDEYLRAEQARPLPQRLWRGVRDHARMHYREAALAYAQRRYADTVRHFALSALLHPSYALRRAWAQLTGLHMEVV